MLSPLRNRLALTLLTLVLLTSFHANAQSTPPTTDEWKGTEEEKLWGLMTVWAEVKYTFPHFDRMSGFDWDLEVQECIPRVLAADDVDTYYAILMELVAQLQDSHTLVLPPWGHIKPEYDFAPIEVRVLEGRFYVDRVGDRPELAGSGIKPGVEILAIDGTQVQAYFAEQVLRTHTMGSPHADEATLIVYLLYGPKNEATTLRIKGLDGVTTDVAVTRDAMSGDPPFMTRMLVNVFASPTIRTKRLPGGIQYVEIPNFEHEQAREDFKLLIDTLEEGEIPGMILDLRYNMGGSNAISEPMVACLIEQSVASPTMKFRHFVGAHQAWGNDPIWETTHNEIQPRDGRKYLGPLVILINGVTNSSAEDFAIELRSAGRARLVGQRTAGGAGNALVSSLPGGGTLRVSTFTALTPEGEEYVGAGITPDVEVQVDRDHLAAGLDPVLERAVELVSGM